MGGELALAIGQDLRLRVEFRGLEHRPQGGVIIAAKHESFLETFALLEYAPDFAIILKRELLFIPLFGQYIVAAQQIAIDRARGRRALTQIAAAALPVIAGGRQIIIYPEGTRRMAGAPPRYKFGVTALYLGAGAPCHPVALNTGLFWGRRGFSRRPGVAVIEFLPRSRPASIATPSAPRLQGAIEAACDRLNAEAVARDPSLAAVLAQGKQSEPTTAEGDAAESALESD